MANLQQASLRDVASLILPWTRPAGSGINDPFIKQNYHLDLYHRSPEPSVRGSFPDHQQITSTCHEFRDTEFWMKAFISMWRREAWDARHGLSVTVRVRRITSRTTPKGQNMKPAGTLHRKAPRLFAHFIHAPPCRSFCSAAAKRPGYSAWLVRSMPIIRNHTFDVEDSAQASEIIQELARPLGGRPHEAPASEPRHPRRRRSNHRQLDDSEEINPLGRAQ
jgi:hypothetical protein